MQIEAGVLRVPRFKYLSPNGCEGVGHTWAAELRDRHGAGREPDHLAGRHPEPDRSGSAFGNGRRRRPHCQGQGQGAVSVRPRWSRACWRGGPPSESAPLQGLVAANKELILDLQCRKPQRIATLDIDATVIHASKRSAKRAYDGERGYQPVLVLCKRASAPTCRMGSSGGVMPSHDRSF